MASVDMCEHDWPGTGCKECFPFYYEWVIVDIRETSYLKIIKFLKGFFKTENDVKLYYGQSLIFTENFMSLKPLQDTGLPYYKAKKTGQFVFKRGS